MSGTKKNKIYAYYLLDSQESGIFYTWNECEQKVKGKKARYKSFKSEKEAQEWLKSGAEYEKKEKKNENLFLEFEKDGIYFDAGTGRGEGVEVRLTDYDGNSLLYEILEASKINKYGNYKLSDGRTNNFGELTGLFAALKYAKKNMPVMKENNQLKQDVLNCIQKLNQKDLSIENVVEYIDYVSKIRYTEKEIISALLEIIKYGME